MASADGSNIWALLVGIDQFAAQSNLDGCKNDAEAMRMLLVGGYGVPPAQVKMLADHEATRQGIIDTFKRFLIENEDIPRGSQIVFHFSGHGANMLDPLDASPSGYIESLVAHDSGLDGIFNIPDTTVGALLELLAQAKGDNITVILDCCHSGSGTRTADKKAPKVRLTEPDRRVPPQQLDAEIVQAARALGVGKRWREEGVPYTLLAGCRDRELAQEYIDYNTEGEPAHGAFTFFLTESLWSKRGGVSYAMVHEQVAADVNSYNPYQMPQVEGNVDRAVLGDAVVPRDPFITVVDVQKGNLVLGGGRVHGIGKGAVLELFSKDIKTRDELPETPLATCEVTSVTASRAVAYVDGVAPETLLLARGVVLDHGEVSPKRTVALRAADDATDAVKAALAELEVRIAGGELPAGGTARPSQWVRLAADEQQAEFLVWGEAEGLIIRGSNDPQRLVEPADMDGRPALATLGALESLCRYRRVAGLKNTDPGSKLQGNVRLRLRRYVEGQNPRDMPIVEPTDGELVLTYDAEAEENLFMIEVQNNGNKPVYTNVLTLNADFSITRMYPLSGGEQSIDPGQSLFVGHTSPDELMDVWLPGDDEDEPFWTISRNRLKLVATLKPTDLGMLEQHGLSVPPPTKNRSGGLEDLLSSAVNGHRMARRRKKKTEDWATADLPFTVVRKDAAIDVRAGETDLADGMVLHAPAGFSAEVQVETLGQATRSVDGLRPPPGLERAEGFAAVGRTGTRGLGENGLVVSLSADDDQLAKIGADNPLRVSTRGGGEMFAIAFDGEDYVLAGMPDGEGITAITRLPAPTGPASRGAVTRSVKLFFYKKFGQETPTLGLKRATVDGDEVSYGDVGEVAPGSRTLLLVHGFASGTLGQVRALAPQLGEGYDTLLTFDYESVGTSVAANGKALAQALAAAGFGADDGRTLDVIGHSMGGLVSRAMIELYGGHRFVDRLVMAGTPNKGTKLFDRVEGALALANMAINKFIGGPAGTILQYLIDAVNKNAAGPRDLGTESAFIKTINAVRAVPVPYLVLSGRGGLVGEDAGRLKRVLLKGVGVALDMVFGEDHDLVVGVSHIEGVMNGGHPALTVAPATCNHFSYYIDPPSVERVQAFFRGEAS